MNYIENASQNNVESSSTMSLPRSLGTTLLTSTTTGSRTISDVHVDGNIVDECFRM